MNKLLTVIALLPLLAQTGSQPIMQVAYMDNGNLLGYVPLASGAGVSIAYQAVEGGGMFSFTYIAPDGIMTQPAREMSPYGAPDRIIVAACGKYIHVIANWASGQIYRYRLEIPEDAGRCETYEMYFPVVLR